ncbi:MAG: hypothetical protein WCV84_04920 [Patescibacteria group bacterium]
MSREKSLLTYESGDLPSGWYRAFVDYDRFPAFGELAKRFSGPDSVDRIFDGRTFVHRKIGTHVRVSGERLFYLCEFLSDIRASEEIIECVTSQVTPPVKARKPRPVIREEIYAFGEKFPHLQENRPYAGLGSFALGDKGRRCVPVQASDEHGRIFGYGLLDEPWVRMRQLFVCDPPDAEALPDGYYYAYVDYDARSRTSLAVQLKDEFGDLKQVTGTFQGVPTLISDSSVPDRPVSGMRLFALWAPPREAQGDPYSVILHAQAKKDHFLTHRKMHRRPATLIEELAFARREPYLQMKRSIAALGESVRVRSFSTTHEMYPLLDEHRGQRILGDFAFLPSGPRPDTYLWVCDED